MGVSSMQKVEDYSMSTSPRKTGAEPMFGPLLSSSKRGTPNKAQDVDLQTLAWFYLGLTLVRLLFSFVKYRAFSPYATPVMWRMTSVSRFFSLVSVLMRALPSSTHQVPQHPATHWISTTTCFAVVHGTPFHQVPIKYHQRDWAQPKLVHSASAWARSPGRRGR